MQKKDIFGWKKIPYFQKSLDSTSGSTRNQTIYLMDELQWGWSQNLGGAGEMKTITNIVINKC
jgi:hypothetical protein